MVSGVRLGKTMPALLFAAVVVCGCSADYGPPINGDRALSPEEQRLQAVENKTVDLSRRLSALEAAQSGYSSDELRALRGQVEQLRYDFDTAQQKNAQQLADLDARLKRLEAGQPPGTNVAPGQAPDAGLSAPPPAPAPTQPVAPVGGAQPQTPAAPAGTTVATAAADEEALYLKNFDLLRANRLDEAIRGFKAQLAKYPQGNYADNAWYWLGQSYYVKQDYANALHCYQSLLQAFPTSPKVPDALLGTGLVYQAQQKTALARQAFNRVVKDYPSSGAAAQARSRLAQLR
jgi:tol-pal system protein YbgF